MSNDKFLRSSFAIVILTLVSVLLTFSFFPEKLDEILFLYYMLWIFWAGILIGRMTLEREVAKKTEVKQ